MIHTFASYQRTRGFSRDTVRRRTGTLSKLQGLIAPTALTAASSDDIQEFLSLHPSASTRHAYRSDLQMFFRWAHRRGLVDSNPVELVDPIRVPHSLPRPVPAGLVPGLVASAPNEMVRYSVALAAYAGLRICEIAKLEASDVNTVNMIIVVRGGKGGKDRLVPLHPVLASILRSPLRRNGRIVPFAKNTIGVRVAEHLRACGLESTAHKLRATFATELALASGGNVVLVGRVLGHVDPSTTMRYVGWSGGEAAATVAKLYPDAA